MKTITIANVTSKNDSHAQAIVRTLQGKSYLNLQVKFAPAGGSCDVLV